MNKADILKMLDEEDEIDNPSPPKAFTYTAPPTNPSKKEVDRLKSENARLNSFWVSSENRYNSLEITKNRLKREHDSLREKYKDLQSVNLNIIKEKEVLKKRYEDILEENIHLNMTEETIEEKIEPTKSSNTFMDKVLISIIWSPIIFSVFIFLGYFYNALPEQKYASQTISAPLKVKSAPLKVKAAPFKEPVKKVLKSIELISTQDCISNIKYLDKNHDIHEELIWEWTEYAGFENTKSRYLVDGRDNWKYNIERNISIDNYIVMQCENHPPLRTNNPNLNDRYRRATEKMSK